MVSRSFFLRNDMSGYYPCAARKRYELYRQTGICVCCGQRDAMPGRVLCDLCRMTAKDSTRLVYYDRREDHRCTRCGKAMSTSGSVCAECADHLRRQAQIRRQQRIDAGLCVRCGKRPADGGRECALCRAKRNGE